MNKQAIQEQTVVIEPMNKQAIQEEQTVVD